MSSEFGNMLSMKSTCCFCAVAISHDFTDELVDFEMLDVDENVGVVGAAAGADATLKARIEKRACDYTVCRTLNF